MSDCDDVTSRDLLPDLMHDRLAPLVRASVEAHVAACADCAAELELLRAARASYARVPAIDTSRIAAAVMRETRRRPTRSVWQRPSWRIAAAISIISIGGLSVAVARRGVDDGGRRDSTMVAGARDTGSGVVASASTPAESTGADDRARSDTATLAPGMAATPVRLTFGGELTDLSDDDLRTLIASVDRVEAAPAEEPEHITPFRSGGTSQ